MRGDWLGSESLREGKGEEDVASRAPQTPTGKKASELLASLHTSSGSAWRRAPGAESHCRPCRQLADLPETPLAPSRSQDHADPRPPTDCSRSLSPATPTLVHRENNFRPLYLSRADSVVTTHASPRTRTLTRAVSRDSARAAAPHVERAGN